MTDTKKTEVKSAVTVSTVKGYFVYATQLSVGGAFRLKNRGDFLRNVEVAKLKTIKCGKSKTMFDELLERKQIGIGHPDEATKNA